MLKTNWAFIVSTLKAFKSVFFPDVLDFSFVLFSKIIYNFNFLLFLDQIFKKNDIHCLLNLQMKNDFYRREKKTEKGKSKQMFQSFES